MARRLDVPAGAHAFNKTFDVALHLGTLVAVVAYFWRDLIRYLVAWFRSARAGARSSVQDEKIAWLIVVASIPAAIIGAAFESVIEDHLGEPWQIAILLAVFARRPVVGRPRPERQTSPGLSMRQGLLLGLAQSLALAPGVSRSGDHDQRRPVPGAHTGRSRTALVPPARADRTRRRAPQGLKDVVFGDLPAGWVGPFVVGTLTAAGSGLLAISWLLGYLRRHDYSLFVFYRLAIAAAILILIATGARTPPSDRPRPGRREDPVPFPSLLDITHVIVCRAGNPQGVRQLVAHPSFEGY